MRFVALTALAVLAGCVAHPVGPARTYGSFRGKAVTTAETALSAVETVRLVASAAADGKVFGPFGGVTISEQEEALSGVQGTFASIQPPDPRADDLRGQLDELLTHALDHVVDVRVATRRGNLAELGTVAAPLEQDAQALREFVEAES